VNDVIKSIVAVTLLAMLGGFAVAVTNKIVTAPHREAVAVGTPSPDRAPRADSIPENNGPRDSASVKDAR
jgi:hypothetical protein